MRVYGKLESVFWQNPKVCKLSDSSKLLLIYIYSSPHGNSVGCFVLPDGYISADMRWNIELVTKHVSELVSEGFIERNNDTNIIRIIGWFDHNTIENDNVAKSAIKTVKVLPCCNEKDKLINDMISASNKFINKYRNELLNELLNPEPEPKPDITIHTDVREKTDFQKVYESGCEIFPSLTIAATEIIHKWLQDGCRPDSDIIPVIKRHTRKNINSWTYFTGAVMDAKATRLNPLPEGKINGYTGQPKSQIQRAVEATERARAAREQRSTEQTG